MAGNTNNEAEPRKQQTSKRHWRLGITIALWSLLAYLLYEKL